MANPTPKEMIHEICRDKTEQEWFEVQSKLKEYFQSDAPEDDKKQVAQYTEMVAMVCSGYEYMHQQEKKQG